VPNTSTPLLADRVILVTGAARGIGRAISECCAAHGARVALLDIGDPDAYRTAHGYRPSTCDEFDQAVSAVKSHGGDALQITADVRDLDQMRRAAGQVTRAFGRLDVVVANAGFVSWHPFEDGSSEQWHEVFETNVHGVWNTMQAAIPAMRQQRSGRIIVTSSVGGRYGVPGNGAYTASKWAVIGMVKQAAAELGKYGIAVNAVAPGPVDTPMFRSEGQRQSMGVTTPEEQDRIIAPLLPLGGKPIQAPEEIGDAVVFLASDLARAVSGASLDVAAGFNVNYTA
jgi:NAD(P)-dependent dehydrogenase (short-subunit alcohol dehydrogenase family)